MLFLRAWGGAWNLRQASSPSPAFGPAGARRWCSPLWWRPCRASGMFSRGPPLAGAFSPVAWAHVRGRPRRGHPSPALDRARRSTFRASPRLPVPGPRRPCAARRLLAPAIFPHRRGKAGLLRRLLRNPAQRAMSLLPHTHAWPLSVGARSCWRPSSASRAGLWPFHAPGPSRPPVQFSRARCAWALAVWACCRADAGALRAPWRAPVGISSRRGGRKAQDPPVPRPGACARRAWPVPESPWSASGRLARAGRLAEGLPDDSLRVVASPRAAAGGGGRRSSVVNAVAGTWPPGRVLAPWRDASLGAGSVSPATPV